MARPAASQVTESGSQARAWQVALVALLTQIRSLSAQSMVVRLFPEASHVARISPKHAVEAGVHEAAAQPPSAGTQVSSAGHAVDVPQDWPLGTHVCTPTPAHRLAPGVQARGVHWSATQAQPCGLAAQVRASAQVE